MSQVLAAVLHRRESPPTEYSVLIRILTNQAVPSLSLASCTRLPRVNHPRLLAWLKEERLVCSVGCSYGCEVILRLGYIRLGKSLSPAPTSRRARSQEGLPRATCLEARSPCLRPCKIPAEAKGTGWAKATQERQSPICQKYCSEMGSSGGRSQ